MSVVYRIAKNYTLQLSAVVLAVSVVGLLLTSPVLGMASPDLDRQVRTALGAWGLWVLLLSALGALMGGWYFGEQLYKRRKFERLLETDKRSDFVGSRKTLEDLAKTLPDRYKPRIAEKEATFATSKRR